MDGDLLRAMLLTVSLLAFALYLGGAISMELILRFAQDDLPGSQTAITCKVSGDRWKWIALISLISSGVTLLWMLLTRSPIIPEAYGAIYSVAALGSGSSWITLMIILLKMSFRAHPALTFRPDPGMPPEEFTRTREALKRAIRRMDRLLRIELAMAVFMGACLSVLTSLAVQ